ncbi:Flp pilus assembly protein CpaB [Bdellovibrio bacteriovorus]|uniref:Flp pilus assembly protein CpaB n=1 Tax=Bdellovibrio bacteriovorus TaxID=959 RepID=A0A150WQR6_BDEBC|nr:Flp pilus assembly protein CpaB [Bdellovibrio bacteriovorus]KYG66831.1 Flp pilus assembly protein CpaB [Bdellovibrio bacteriovorus]
MGSNETRNLWLSIAAGVFATFLLYSYSQEKKAEYDKRFGSTKRIVVAKEDIAEMQTIYDTMVEVKEMPADFIQPDAISIPDEIIGNVAAVPIRKGQMVVKNNLLTPGPDTGIALQVAPSKRAVTIPIDEVRAVAKLVRPGDRVDIYAAVDNGKGVNQRREVFVMMSDVVVLATGVSVVNNIPRMFEIDSTGKNVTQIALTGDTKYTTITIEATPKEAQDLFYILSTAPGNLFFALRNPSDRAVPARLPSSTSDSVLGKPVMADMPVAPQIALPPRPAFTPPVQQQRPQTPRRNGFQTL